MSEPQDQGVIVTCPMCWRKTNCIQAHEVAIVLNAFFYLAWNTDRVVGCPTCVRSRLWQRFGESIILSNVLFIVTGPLILWSISSSHKQDGQGVADEFLYLQHLAPPPVPTQAQPVRGSDDPVREMGNEVPLLAPPEASDGQKRLRIVLVVLILAVVLGVVFFVLPNLQ